MCETSEERGIEGWKARNERRTFGIDQSNQLLILWSLFNSSSFLSINVDPESELVSVMEVREEKKRNVVRTKVSGLPSYDHSLYSFSYKVPDSAGVDSYFSGSEYDWPNFGGDEGGVSRP